MKETGSLLVKTNITKRNMLEVEMKTTELFPTLEATERVFKILDSTYESADIENSAFSAN